MKTLKYKVARIYDTTAKVEFVCEMKVKRQRWAFSGEKSFVPHCAWCRSKNVVVIEETIQFGLYQDKHYLLSFCLACTKATYHIYKVEDENVSNQKH